MFLDPIILSPSISSKSLTISLANVNKKAKRIVLAINFSLSADNNEASYAKVVSAGAFLADVLNKLGYAVEIIGTSSN